MRGMVRSDAERARLLDAYRASGMSAKSFAARENIAASTLYQWLAELKATATRPRIARVIRHRTVVAKEETKRECSALLVEIGGARVHVPTGYDPSTLARVLELLDARASGS